MRAKYHRPFLWTALAFTALATPLGAALLGTLCGWFPLRSWPRDLQAHGQWQVYGFVVIFTMGVAHQMLSQVFGQRKGRVWIDLGLVTMASGTAIRGLSGPDACGTSLQLLGVLSFLYSVMANRPASSAPKAAPVHAHFLRLGVLWLLAGLFGHLLGASVTWELDVALWGFVTHYILGVGLRIHPGLLKRPTPSDRPQRVLLLLWNLGMTGLCWPALRPWSDLCWLAGVCLVLSWLRPWTRLITPEDNRWLFGYLTMAYFGLLVAVLGRLVPWTSVGLEGATRHALTTGFILPMMMGMAFRLVPAFEGRSLRWPGLRSWVFGLMLAGTSGRVLGEAALGLGWLARWAALAGLTQAVAMSLFLVAMVEVLTSRPVSLK